MPRVFRPHYTALIFFVLFAFCAAGTSQTVSLSASTLNFGNQTFGTRSAAQSVTLTNTGAANLSFSGISVLGTNRLDWSPLAGNCAGNIKPGKTCTISAQFTPQVTGPQSAYIQITDNAASSPQTVNLSGVGVAPVAIFSSPSLNFGVENIGNSAMLPLTLTNGGNVSMTVHSLSVTGNYSQSSNCGTLAPNASCTISVTFAPMGTWSLMGQLTVHDDAGTQIIPLSGMGSSGGIPTLSAAKLSYTQTLVVGTSATQTATLTNTGPGSVELQGVTASGDYTQTNNCPAVLGAGVHCTLTVSFAPTWPAYRPGEIVLTYTNPPMVQVLTLAGSGKAAATDVAVSPRQYSLTSNQTVQFTASINGSSTGSVNWFVDGVANGNNAVGKISGGVYAPPSTAGSHTITAVSASDSSQAASATVHVTSYAGTFTYHNDVARTGQNLAETVLTTANVNTWQFGKLFSYSLDGYVYAQPLYVPGVAIQGQGTHNVIYAVTEHDSAYALDADTKKVLWHVSFINVAQGVTTVPSADVTGDDLVPEIGITGTPVIDPANSTIYFVATTKESVSGSYQYMQRLHALDITTGNERPGSPVVVSALAPGTGAGHNSQNQIPFSGLRQNQRPALLLLNGKIYVAWGSHNDAVPFHGWVAEYDENSLQQTDAYISTPNATEGGIWQGGAGPSADSQGSVYVATSNGTFDAAYGGVDFGDSILRLNPAAGLSTAADYFTPFNQAYMSVHNVDLGSGGILVLPDQTGSYHLMVGGGKGDTLYLINRDNLGGYSPTQDQVVQELVNIFPPNAVDAGIRGVSAYFNNSLYTGAIGDHLKSFTLYNGKLSTGPLTVSAHTFYYPGVVPAVSANGSSQAIAWALETGGYANSSPVVLHAYDAANLGMELYNSKINPARDTAGGAVKFTVPTVANGKVYVPAEYELDVFGLLP